MTEGVVSILFRRYGARVSVDSARILIYLLCVWWCERSREPKRSQPFGCIFNFVVEYLFDQPNLNSHCV